MKPSYFDVLFKNGLQWPGISRIKIAPRQWLLQNVQPNFLDGTVNNTIQLITDKSWIALQCPQSSFTYEELPKQVKAGSYYDIKIQGIINNTSAIVMQTLQTLRHFELVAIVNDNNKNGRIVGNINNGLTFSCAIKNNNSAYNIAIEMAMQIEQSPPFYLYDDNNDTNNNNNNNISNVKSTQYRATGNENYIILPELADKEILGITRGGMEVEDILTSGSLANYNQVLFNSINGRITFNSEQPLAPNEFIRVFYK